MALPLVDPLICRKREGPAGHTGLRDAVHLGPGRAEWAWTEQSQAPRFCHWRPGNTMPKGLTLDKHLSLIVTAATSPYMPHSSGRRQPGNREIPLKLLLWAGLCAGAGKPTVVTTPSRGPASAGVGGGVVRRGGGRLSGCHRERQGVGSGVDLPVEAMTGLRAERRATRAGLGLRAAETASCRVPGRGRREEGAKPDGRVPSRREAEGTWCRPRPDRRRGQRPQGLDPQAVCGHLASCLAYSILDPAAHLSTLRPPA